MHNSGLVLLARSSRLWLRLALAVVFALTVFTPAPAPTLAAGGQLVFTISDTPPSDFPCTKQGYNDLWFAVGFQGIFGFVTVIDNCPDLDVPTVEPIGNVTIIGEPLGGILNAPAASRVTLDAQGLGRVFAITTTAHLTLENLTIINGDATSGFGSGGDIYNAGTLVVRNSEIAHGAAGYGGGLFTAAGATSTLVDSIVDFNHATVNGGGLGSAAGAHLSLQFTGSANTTCICSNTAANDGAGIFSQGALDVAAGTLFNKNAAGYAGGALAALDGNAVVLAPSSQSASSSLALAPGNGLALAAAAIAPTRFISNSAGLGGGGAIYNTGALALSHVAVLSNTASYSGGGIESYTGTLQIANAFIAYNTTSYGGGGIENGWTLTATAMAVISNTGRYQGGGLDTYHGAVSISDSTFMSNTAMNSSSAVGGGITVNSGNLHLDRSTVADNVVDNAGGGLYNSGTTTIANSTFSANAATGLGGGGGINNNGALTITSSTLVSNSAPGEVGNLANSGGAWLHNTIVAFGDSPNCSGTITSTGYNLEDANTCHLHATGDLSNTTPLLGPLQNNGGTLAGAGGTALPLDGQAAWTHALLVSSAAINTGDPGNCPATDERGAIRPVVVCDIGAYEFGAKIPQTINFTLPALLTPNQSPYPLGGAATSGLAVSYTEIGPACSLAAGSLLLNSHGACLVTAHQAGDANYNAAGNVPANTAVGFALFLPLARR